MCGGWQTQAVMLDLLIVLAFVAYAITVGFRARRVASKNLTEYFLAGRTIRGWRAGVSMAASQFAADTPLLVTGLIATAGVFALWRLWIYALAFLLLAFVMAGMWRRARVLTDAEFTEVRYSGRGVLSLRVLKALYYGTVFNCIVMAWVMFAAVRIAEIFLPWHLWLPAGIYDPLLNLITWSGLSLGGGFTDLPEAHSTLNNIISVLLILGFTALYSTTGGLRSVISTDVMQFAIMMIGTIFYAIYVVRHEAVGGLGNLSRRVVSIYGEERAGELLSFWPPPGELVVPFIMVVAIQWFVQINSDGTGYLAQRAMACSSDRQARIAGVVFTWLQIFVRSMVWLIIGVGILVIYPFAAGDTSAEGFTAGREILFATGMDELLPAGIRGLMLTAMLAALASTLDTHLNWGASYWSNDIYRRLICEAWRKRQPENRELVIVARLSNILIVVIALVVMANLQSVQQAWTISLLFGAAVGPVLVLRWVWERINLYSELAAIAMSLFLAPVLLFLGGQIGPAGLSGAWEGLVERNAFAGNVFNALSEEWIRLVVMGGLAMLVAVATAFLAPATDPAVLKKFYERVRPMGYWRRTAAVVGRKGVDPVEGLWRNIGTLALCALSLFLILAGCGRLLIPAPGISTGVSWLLLIAGAVLIPFWWDRAFPETEK
jgi:solute:Na+ symporter, SSS family